MFREAVRPRDGSMLIGADFVEAGLTFGGAATSDLPATMTWFLGVRKHTATELERGAQPKASLPEVSGQKPLHLVEASARRDHPSRRGPENPTSVSTSFVAPLRRRSA